MKRACGVTVVRRVIPLAVCAMAILAGCTERAPEKFFDDIEAGDLGAVQAALDAHPGWARAKRAPLPEFGTDGPSALWWAAMHGRKAVVELLLDRGAPVDGDWWDKGSTPLFPAISKGHNDVVELLIAKGAKVNVRKASASRSAPLHVAVDRSNTEAARLLLDAGADVNIRDAIGRTPLHTSYDSQDATELLLAHGADVNAKDELGYTPLHLAAEWARCERVVQILLAHGANVNAKNSEGQTPLHFAQRHGGAVDLLLAHGAVANVEDKYGMTPMHTKFFADIESGDLAAIQAALDVHPDWVWVSQPGRLFLMNPAENQPLHLAASCTPPKKAVAELLLDNGADVNAKNMYGHTALHMAVAHGYYSDNPVHKDFIEFLLARGADVNARDNARMTPLHMVTKDCNKGAARFASFLLDAGADVNAKNDDGDTPLHQAAHCAGLEADAHGEGERVAQILVAHGADVNAKNSEGRTPLDMAEGKKGMVDLLVAHGAVSKAGDR